MFGWYSIMWGQTEHDLFCFKQKAVVALCYKIVGQTTKFPMGLYHFGIQSWLSKCKNKYYAKQIL